MSAPRSNRTEVDGWVVLDKPIGLTSTQAVSRLKRIFNARKAGHAGTLDPLASGILPVAFGEATKTVPFVQDGEKTYRFEITWGAQTNTDDAEGEVIHTSGLRPHARDILALLPRFTGTMLQVPPAFSAIKINGERAYDLSRQGAVVDIAARPVTVHALRLTEADADSAVLEADCGKGTYVRSIARDMGQALGCYGHVTALRRTRVGAFHERDAVPLSWFLDQPGQAHEELQAIEAGLTEIASVIVDRDQATRLRRGQSLLLRGRDAPASGAAYAICGGVVIAVGEVKLGELVPTRVFNSSF